MKQIKMSNRKIFKTGSSYAVILDKRVADYEGLKIGDTVNIVIEKDE